MDFAGKNAIVTGANGNLGKAVVRRFADSGARLVLMGRNEKDLRALADSLPGRHLAVSLDLANRDETENRMQAAEAEIGSPDILLALAGGFDMGPKIGETTAEDWDAMWQANVGTLLPVLTIVSEKMKARKSGKIITVGALAAQRGSAGMAPYCVAKTAVLRITEALSAELKPSGINVNCVLPAILDTPQNRDAMPEADTEKWVQPDSLADIIAFLASDAASDLHGEALVVGR